MASDAACSGDSSPDVIDYFDELNAKKLHVQLDADLEVRERLRNKARFRHPKLHRALRSADTRLYELPSGEAASAKCRIKARTLKLIKEREEQRQASVIRNFRPAQFLPPKPAGYTHAQLVEMGLPVELVRLMLALQDGREVEPEDYDLLLQLDEFVAAATKDSPKLVTAALLSLPELTLTADEEVFALVYSSCAVCMDEFGVGDVVKELHCGHLFHAACITDWALANGFRTAVCPLDKVPLFRPPERVERVTVFDREAARVFRLPSVVKRSVSNIVAVDRVLPRRVEKFFVSLRVFLGLLFIALFLAML